MGGSESEEEGFRNPSPPDANNSVVAEEEEEDEDRIPTTSYSRSFLLKALVCLTKEKEGSEECIDKECEEALETLWDMTQSQVVGDLLLDHGFLGIALGVLSSNTNARLQKGGMKWCWLVLLLAALAWGKRTRKAGPLRNLTRERVSFGTVKLYPRPKDCMPWIWTFLTVMAWTLWLLAIGLSWLEWRIQNRMMKEVEKRATRREGIKPTGGHFTAPAERDPHTEKTPSSASAPTQPTDSGPRLRKT